MKTPSPSEALLSIGMSVRHKNRRNVGFGIAACDGVIRGFIEPQPGWHRALVNWVEDETEQYIDTNNLEPIVAVERAALVWVVIAVDAAGHGLGTCEHEHVTADEASACSWTPDPWPEVCDLLVRQVRKVTPEERARAEAKKPKQLSLFGRPLRQGG